MQAQLLKTWIARRLSVRTRLEPVCVSYLLFLMVVTQKHSLTEAARFTGLNKSAFCKVLREHCKVAASTLLECCDLPFAVERYSIESDLPTSVTPEEEGG